MRRRMLISQQKKSNNLFDESLLLTQQSGYCKKVENGYSFKEYPTQYSQYQNPNEPLTNYLKSVLKADTTYTFACNVISRGYGTAGAIFLRSSSAEIVKLAIYGLGQRVTTFSLTQEQIDSIYSVYIYGTRDNQLGSYNPTVIKEFQLLEGAYTLDTLPPYEPYEE